MIKQLLRTIPLVLLITPVPSSPAASTPSALNIEATAKKAFDAGSKLKGLQDKIIKVLDPEDYRRNYYARENADQTIQLLPPHLWHLIFDYSLPLPSMNELAGTVKTILGDSSKQTIVSKPIKIADEANSYLQATKALIQRNKMTPTTGCDKEKEKELRKQCLVTDESPDFQTCGQVIRCAWCFGQTPTLPRMLFYFHCTSCKNDALISKPSVYGQDTPSDQDSQKKYILSHFYQQVYCPANYEWLDSETRNTLKTLLTISSDFEMNSREALRKLLAPAANPTKTEHYA